jgi:hypothetical protein
LLGASLLAAAILPLSTAYSVSEALGREARVEASIREEPVFYGTYALVVESARSSSSCRARRSCRSCSSPRRSARSCFCRCWRSSPCSPANASLMGEYATGRAWTVVIVAVTLMIAAATIVLGLVLLGA